MSLFRQAQAAASAFRSEQMQSGKSDWLAPRRRKRDACHGSSRWQDTQNQVVLSGFPEHRLAPIAERCVTDAAQRCGSCPYWRCLLNLLIPKRRLALIRAV